jgi:RNA polymerase sigma factor (sigma-70 family)
MIGRTKGHGEDSITDEALVSGIAVGDEQASLAFVRRYQGRLFGLAIGIVRDSALAEDVAQEAFIRIIRHAAVFDPRRGSVASWALTITRNLAIDVLRVRRGTPTDPDDQVFLELMSIEPSPDEAVVTGQAVDRARAALSHLPLGQRRAVVLASMYGWTAQEIATEDGIPLGTAKGRIRVGMAKLREFVVSEEAS